VADEFGKRCERGGALAGAEGRDQERGVLLVQIRRRSLLISAQDAGKERRVHAAIFLLVYLAHTDSSDCKGKPSAHFGRVSISRCRIAFASSARAASTSQTISSCVVMRIGMNASAGFVSIRVTVSRRRSAAVAWTAFSTNTPNQSFARP